MVRAVAIHMMIVVRMESCGMFAIIRMTMIIWNTVLNLPQ